MKILFSSHAPFTTAGYSTQLTYIVNALYTYDPTIEFGFICWDIPNSYLPFSEKPYTFDYIFKVCLERNVAINSFNRNIKAKFYLCGERKQYWGKIDLFNKDFKVSTNGMKQKQLFDSKGYPGVKMPWGALTSIDLNKGKIIWQVPLGNFEELKHITDTGTLNYGGATASAGDLVFASGTLDKKLRAFDASTGEVLWSYNLPYIGSAPPTIYEAKGEQYLMIPATGSWSLKNVYPELVEYGDAFLAFKIKK